MRERERERGEPPGGSEAVEGLPDEDMLPSAFSPRVGRKGEKGERVADVGHGPCPVPAGRSGPGRGDSRASFAHVPVCCTDRRKTGLRRPSSPPSPPPSSLAVPGSRLPRRVAPRLPRAKPRFRRRTAAHCWGAVRRRNPGRQRWNGALEPGPVSLGGSRSDGAGLRNEGDARGLRSADGSLSLSCVCQERAP